jgi:histidinol dehydrogenase
MKVLKNPPRENWEAISERPQLALEFLESSVRNTLNRVKKSGDEALKELTLLFDKVSVANLRVTQNEVDNAAGLLPDQLKKSIRAAAENIKKFHSAQRREDVSVETMPGVTCWRRAVPINRIGIYIPGGSAPLFSTVLMLAVPAQLAGCSEIVLCTPPDKNGAVNPAILFAASLAGINKIFKVGGAQAIAAMAYGTETIPKVYKIFGPGNQYVTKAKQMVTEDGIAIDMPAGPSEVLVMADNSSKAAFVAADLLSQAEHGEDSQVILVLLDEKLLPPIQQEIEAQLQSLPRKAIAERALANSRVVIFDKQENAIAFINEYSPEHLILNVANAEEIIPLVFNAGSVFLGNYTPEAAGDYASGTNHTLPTNGYAKAYAGVSLDSFLKYITYQKITEAGMRNIGPIVAEMAEAEELMGHKNAILLRLATIKS